MAVYKRILTEDDLCSAGTSTGSGSLKYPLTTTATDIAGVPASTLFPKGTSLEDILRQILQAEALPDITFTVEPNGSSTVTTTKVTITFSDDLPTALTLPEITLPSSLTVGKLVKVNNYTYTLEIGVAASGTRTMTIAKAGVDAAPVSFPVYYAGVVVAPIGWWGFWYPTGGTVGNPTFDALDDRLIDLDGTTEITGSKVPHINIYGNPLESDWNKFATPVTWDTWDDYGYQAFIITKDWGIPSMFTWDGAFDQTAASKTVSVVINGETYTGRVMNYSGVGDEFRFIFP